ncbi:extensin-like domain-containing protein [Vannielia litorea]|uniref:extensin-like domain-containing protein n=1 Tax=Vannielia litorea TaxID=1217970 RepID=UPI001BD1B9C8|nr:extensin family protein [Vannielia litorea]MBS8225802.1 hypothetical protein [Vannielia litorea]
MIRLAAVLLAIATPALANAPESSLRPLQRPGAEAAEAADPDTKTVVSTRGVAPQPEGADTGHLFGPKVAEKRPLPRPEEWEAPVMGTPALAGHRPRQRPAAATDQMGPVRVVLGVRARDALHAKPRPTHIDRLVKEQATLTEVKFARKGSVCGINSIKGQAISSFGRPGNGCGVANPVQVTSVQGISLSSTATMDCGTAKALDRWVKKGLKPAIGRQGGGVKQIKVVAHYACRNRNNAKSGRLSEHAKGRAVDIAGVTLRDGTYVSVLKGWGSKTWSKALRVMHKAACGPFGTVLGPNANRYHRDHFHFDTARYRSGSYCR